MFIATLQTSQALKPQMSVHGDIVKLDLGALLIEIDRDGFKELLAVLTNQAYRLRI